MTTRPVKWWPDALPLLAVSGLVAYLAPAPWWDTDRGVYERMGREFVVSECAELHCFRPLVSWVLGRLPGPPIVVWKSYAVVCQVGAGLAMAHWVSRWGASATAARQSAWLTTLGSGASYTLFDPHTADPLMHLLAPALMLLIDRGRTPLATGISMVAVVAKEFAAVPLVVSAAARAVMGRKPEAIRLAAGAAAVVAVWALWQVVARVYFGYTFGVSHSTEFTSGGYLVTWLLALSPTLVVAAIAMVFGGLWLLWAAGLFWGPRELRQLTFASLPALLIFNSLQQPDRALWNFAFVALPAAAIPLSRVPPLVGWLLVTVQVVLNVRVGAQLPVVPPARLMLPLAIVIAAAIIVLARKPAPVVVRVTVE